MSVELEWKTIPQDPNNIWIVMTAYGVVDLPETRMKLQKLGETLDYFQQYFSSQKKFMLVFDFSQCKDFAKIDMLGDLKKFLTKYDPLITVSLRKSFILLRDPAWKFFLNLVFAFRPPKQPYALEMPPNLYEAIRHRYR